MATLTFTDAQLAMLKRLISVAAHSNTLEIELGAYQYESEPYEDFQARVEPINVLMNEVEQIVENA